MGCCLPRGSMFRIFTCGVLFPQLLTLLGFGERLLLGLLWWVGGGRERWEPSDF